MYFTVLQVNVSHRSFPISSSWYPEGMARASMHTDTRTPQKRGNIFAEASGVPVYTIA